MSLCGTASAATRVGASRRTNSRDKHEALRASAVGDLDADERIHQYHRATIELWKFCFAGQQPTLITAHMIEDMTITGQHIDWWARGIPRRHHTSPEHPS